MSSGYIEYNNDTGDTINDTLRGYTMTTPTGKEPMPTSGVRWSHLEVVVKKNGAISAVEISAGAHLSWDSNGFYICAGPTASAVSYTAAKTSGSDNYKACVISIDINPTLPGDGGSGTVYFWAKRDHADSSNTKLIRARLHWHELSKG